MVVVGLGFTEHEASAAVVVDGKLRTAIARERLTRIKRDGTVWGSKRFDLSAAIDYCLRGQGLTLEDVDLLVWNHVNHFPQAQVAAQLKEEGGSDLFGIPTLILPHHFAHACCSFYLSPFSEAAVLIVDGSGGPLRGLTDNCRGPEPDALSLSAEKIQTLDDTFGDGGFEHESFYYFEGERAATARKIIGDWRGIGAAYATVSARLFGDVLDAGKTMGLAPYGRYDAKLAALTRTGPDDMLAYRAFGTSNWAATDKRLRAWRNPYWYRALRKVGFMDGAYQGVNYEARLPANVAATIQQDTEEALLTHARWLRQNTDSENLCLGGGVALNCVANSRLAKESGFSRVFVPSAPGDDGISVGCALYGAALHGELQRGSAPVYLGRSYSQDPAEMMALGLTEVTPTPNLAIWLAKEIAQGAVVGWFQAGAELGPRALGHRSFLADPRNPGMRDHLNKVVKKRELFRPFAPVVLEEAVLDYFEEHHPSYFMSFVATVRNDKRALLPAITHIDGTARYQVLRKTDNPELDEVIRAFADITGIPMLLNTSFNRAGQPIVETPQEAARCMLASSVNWLVLDGRVYRPS